MLDRLFLNKLTKKGKIAYWIIQLGLDVILGIVLFGVLDYTLDRGNDGRTFFIVGAVASLLISGLICLSIWKAPKEIAVVDEDKKG
ncbi:hypothetical protein [Galbibacter sp. PAP.153]|uniref:hypothetical protein n=1 Tax=Galbibacter sp. PAP.153 TaxID=3104623 RepID=UPI00300B3995